MTPWDVHADLTLPRLQLITKLLRDTRHLTLALHDPMHENTWALGCRIYARSCHALVQAAHHLPWLGILDDGQRFVFKIGAAPVRFFCGDSKRPSAHHLKRCYADTEWRIAIETNRGGEVRRMVLLAVGREKVHFPIPPDDTLAVFTAPSSPIKRGLSLPPPSVKVLRSKRGKDES